MFVLIRIDPCVSSSWMVRELGIRYQKVVCLAEGEETVSSLISDFQSVWPSTGFLLLAFPNLGIEVSRDNNWVFVFEG